MDSRNDPVSISSMASAAHGPLLPLPDVEQAMAAMGIIQPKAPDGPDRYELAVDYLTAHPEEIREAWENAYTHPHGCIFKYAAPHEWMRTPSGEKCGCLTMVRGGAYVAATPELTAMIRADERLPGGSGDGITVDHLPVFAGWQRRLDHLLNRK
jgi:hypothetical protein